MQPTNSLRTAVILSALYMSTSCTSKPVILGAGGNNEPQTNTPCSGNSADRDSPEPLVAVSQEHAPIAPTALTPASTAPIPVSTVPTARQHTTSPFCEEKVLNEIKIPERNTTNFLTLPRAVIDNKILALLGTKDITNLSSTCRESHKDVGVYTESKTLLAICREGGNYPERLFRRPDCGAVRWIAGYGGAYGESLKHSFMRQFFAYAKAQQDKTKVIEWLREAPRSLLLYGHTSPLRPGVTIEAILTAVRESMGLRHNQRLPFTSADLFRDRAFMLAAVKKDERYLQYISEGLWLDLGFMCEVVAQDGGSIKFIGRHPRFMALNPVQKGAILLAAAKAKRRYCCQKMFSEQKMYSLWFTVGQFTEVNTAVWILTHIDLTDCSPATVQELLLAAAQDPTDELYSEYIQKLDANPFLCPKKRLEFLQTAAKKNGRWVLKHSKEDTSQAKIFDLDDLTPAQRYDIVLAAVTQNGYALEFAPDALKNDLRIVLAAVRSHKSPRHAGKLFGEYASPNLRKEVDELRTNRGVSVEGALAMIVAKQAVEEKVEEEKADIVIEEHKG